MRVLRAVFFLALIFVAGVAAVDVEADVEGDEVPSVTAIPEPASTQQLPPAPTTPVTTTTPSDPLTPAIDATPAPPKKTPGRHCEQRTDCGECLALSYCVWSPSKSTCIDKTKAKRRDRVVTTCDPVVCAAAGGPAVDAATGLPKDSRKPAHVSAKLAGVRGKAVIAEAEAVERLTPKPKYDPLPHLKNKNRRVHVPRTTSDDPHVHIKPGKKVFVFTSDNRGPIIRGEAEERKQRWLREKREHRKLMIKKLLRAQNLLRKPKKSKFRRPEYYPSKKQKLARRNRALARAQAEDERVQLDLELKAQLKDLRAQANHALHARKFLVESKRRKIEDILNKLSDEIEKVNRQAQLIDTDDKAFEAVSKDVSQLSAKVKSVCSVTFALLETQSDAEIDESIESEADAETEAEVDADADVDADAEVDAETATEVESELNSEMEAEQEGFEADN